jgi:hypothetical protein
MRQWLYSIVVVFTVLIAGCKNDSSKNIDSIKVVNGLDLDGSMISPFGDQPAMAIGPDNVIGITFGKEDVIYYSESSDDGVLFSEPEKVGALKGMMLGYSSGPQIAMTKTNIIITAPSKTGNLFAWLKDRNGSSWEGPFRINDVEKSAEECLSSITSTKNGLLFCTWIDTRFLKESADGNHADSDKEKESSVIKEKKEDDLSAMTPIGITKKELYEKIGDVPENTHLAFHDDQEGNLLWVFLDANGDAIKAENYEAYKEFKKRNGDRIKPKGKIYISSSNDSGRTWTKSQMAYKSPDGSVCECCKPSIESDVDGNLFVMFRNNLNGSRDLHYMKSTDNGTTFSEPQKLGSGTWKINGCPMDGGGIALYANNELNTVWQRKGQVYLANSEFSEQLIGPGRSPSISSHGDDTNIVFTAGEEIMAVNSPMYLPVKIGFGNSPRVLSVSGGAIYVWVNDTGVRYKKIMNN